MFQILLEKKPLSVTIVSLLLLSIISQIMIGAIYQKLIRETENLSTTNNKQLKQCKLKFQHCYQLNGSIPNIAVFVDKFIGRLSVIRISLTSLRQVSTQLVMLSVFMCGIGACIGIITGENFFRILPYYLVGLVGLYIYFSVSAIVDISGRKENLKTNLVDYLENHLLSRLQNNVAEDFKEGGRGEKHKEFEKYIGNKKYVEFEKHAENKRYVGTESGIGSEKNIETEKYIVLENQRKSKKQKGFTEPEETGSYYDSDFRQLKVSPETASAARPAIEGNSREKELKAAIAAFSEEEIEEFLRELLV